MRIRIISCTAALLAGLAALPPAVAAQAPPGATSTAGDLASRRRELNGVFAQIWEDRLSHSPEFASTIGDKRWNDQLTDYSVEAYNAELERGREYLLKLGEIDTAGMDEQEVLSKDLMVRQLIEDQEASQFKPWEMPENQFSGLHLGLPQLVPQLSFTSVKDYDDYIARLNKVPNAFRQITDNMMAGMEDHRVPPKYLLEKVLVQVNALLAQKPEDSPFARPLKKFPASVPAPDQTRIRDEMLAAITKQVYPAYQRFAKFLQAQ